MGLTCVLKRFKQNLETGAIASLIIVPLILCVIAFLALACYFGLREALSPSLSALVTAAAAIALIAVVLVIARLSVKGRTPARPQPKPIQPAQEFEKFLREQADPVLARWVREHPNKAAVTTLALGVAAGYSHTVRQVLVDLYLRHGDSESRRR
ncbi:MAG: hypothetical protein LC637_14250, partial [Xanthomonadaceae bacterium]|nr:hypothetical protein [Xanthomonadaceae bacterium]